MYIVEEKADGISISLNYDKTGKLISAVTRGDGIEGEDILSNVLKMKNVITQLPENTKINHLRGEVLIFQKDFEHINYLLTLENEKELKNPRNAAFGISKRLDGKFSEYCTILYYESDGDFNSEFERMNYIKDILNLKTVWYKFVNNEIEANIEYENYINVKRPLIHYDIDGLVIKVNSTEKQQELGFDASKNPIFGIAWKFPPMLVMTNIIGVEWSMGNGNRITPVSILQPVKCGGITITGPTIHNIDIFKKLDLHYNDLLEVSRRNDVLPQIERNLTKVHDDNFKFPIPTHCPLCNSKTEISDKYLICPNLECKGKDLGNLKRWITALNIMDIGEKTIELLYENNFIKCPSDFYKLNVEDISELERMGEKSAEKIISNLMNKICINLSTFIEGLNIPQFSKSRAELLIKNGYNSVEKMLNCKKEELIKIKGIEEATANFIVNGLNNKTQTIKNLLSFITILEIKENTGNLKDLSFCVTGKLNTIDRNTFVDLVKENGGVYKSGISKGLTYLVTNDTESGSTKNQKAKKCGTIIINEEQFLKMIEG